MRAALAMALD